MESHTEVTLTSYATVLAALAAGLDRRRALALAEVAEVDWEPAQARYRAAIDESAATDLTLLVAFDSELTSQTMRFEPTCEPIASDVAAWAAFRRHFVTAPDSVAFLTGHELPLSTYAQLEATWARRCADDTSVADALHGQMLGPLAPCPTLTRTPSPLLAEAVVNDEPSYLETPPASIEASEHFPPAAAAPIEAPKAPWPVLPPPPLPVAAEPIGASTQSFDLRDVLALQAQKPLPFAEPSGEETLVPAVAPDETTLPFRAAGPASPPRHDLRATADLSSLRSGDVSDDELVTQLVPPGSKGPAMPFQAATGSAPATPPPKERRFFEEPPARPGESTVLSFGPSPTEPILPFAERAARGAAASPGAPAPPRAPAELPIERFAVICAELSSGAPLDAVLRKHQLSLMMWTGLDFAWRKRLQAVPAEAARVAEIIHAVKARLAAK